MEIDAFYKVYIIVYDTHSNRYYSEYDFLNKKFKRKINDFSNSFFVFSSSMVLKFNSPISSQRIDKIEKRRNGCNCYLHIFMSYNHFSNNYNGNNNCSTYELVVF